MIKIDNTEFNLEDLLLGKGELVGLKDLVKRNFREIWESYLPNNGNVAGISYDPRPIIKEMHFSEQSDDIFPFFMAVYNPSRSLRPKEVASSNKGPALEKETDKDKHSCGLCKNLIEPKIIIFPQNEGLSQVKSKHMLELEGYNITPNGFPILKYHSLIISKKIREQDDIREKDIVSAMEYSMVMNQFVFYNPTQTGGTINHMHMHCFEYLIAENTKTPFHQLTEKYRNKIRKEECKGNIIESFSIKEYPGENICFVGKNAPRNAIECIKELTHRDGKYNLLIDKEIISVVTRSRTPCCTTGTKYAGLELHGVTVFEDIKDEKGNIITKANDNFDRADYYLLNKALRSCTVQNIKR